METLGEVIKCLSICIQPDTHRLCKDCTYPDEPGCFNELMEDALHYLQSYKQLSEAMSSENVEWRDTGIYCKQCGARLDDEWEEDE